MTDRMTVEELREAQKRADRRRVRNAQAITVDGIRFASRREAARWVALREREAKGEIVDLRRQVPFPLNGQFEPIRTPGGRQMLYLADFSYRDLRLGGAWVVEDAKGHRTDTYLLKRAILAAQGIEIEET